MMISVHIVINNYNRVYQNKQLREGFTKKSSCSFGFCPNGGEGRPAQIVCPLFTNCIYWVNLGMGREGDTPAQIFCHITIQKKWYKLSKLGGGAVNLDKIEKNSWHYLHGVPYILLALLH